MRHEFFTSRLFVAYSAFAFVASVGATKREYTEFLLFFRHRSPSSSSSAYMENHTQANNDSFAITTNIPLYFGISRTLSYPVRDKEAWH
jgi:hypothetical protein